MFSFSKANTALAAAIVFLSLASFAAYFAFLRLRTSQGWVQHTRQVQHAIDTFSITANRAGRLRSEYVDSGDPTLLQRQSEAVVLVRSALSRVRDLTSDNVAQQDNCRKLAELTERRIALMDQALDLRRGGKSTPQAQAAIARQSIAAADETDVLLQSMDAHEEELLAQRQSRERASFGLTVGILLTSMFVALIFFLVHHRVLTEQVRERQRAEVAQRALSARLLNLQDEERRRFARELHDSVGQQLAAMKMALSILQNRLPGDKIVMDCLSLLDDAITETRTISHLLHPPLLDEAGLNSAFRWFVEGFANRSGVNVTLQIEDGTERFDESTELVLFRALQEALTNVHRHSGAKQADVSLNTSGNNVVLRIRDHGRGIPLAVLHSLKGDGPAGGVGLAGMNERIREIGGRLEIRSQADGTEIVVLVPARQRSKTFAEKPTEQQEVV